MTSNIQLPGIENHEKFVTAYTPHDAILIDGNDEFIAQATAESWPGDGTAEAPYQITGYYFYDVQHSLEILNTDIHWIFANNEVDGPGDATVWCSTEISNCSNGVVDNNLFHNRYRGIFFDDVTNVNVTNNIVEDNRLNGIECVGFFNSCLISGNTVERCTGAGIRSVYAEETIISNNVITDCSGAGIQVLVSTTGCQIVDNEITDVGAMGIHLASSISVLIRSNEVSNTSGAGVYLLGSEDTEVYNNSLYFIEDKGIVLSESISDTVDSNTIVTCDEFGISVVSGEKSSFILNRIEDAEDYGLRTGDTTVNMTITRNIFIDNGETAQVCDDGEDNEFIFNYYSDWTSPDANSDQIVDTPYALDGAAGNEDPYPLAAPDVVPTTSATTGPSEGEQIPMEIVMIGGAVMVVLLVVIFFMKRR
jgi:parallel beta-helix repeat protein